MNNIKYFPLVSVIIPTYNRKDNLIEAIESVFAQTYPNYEVIVVDDGSSDGTKEKLQEIRKKLVYIHQNNSGVSTARNKGILSSKGDYIALLDSDDLFMPHHIEQAII